MHFSRRFDGVPFPRVATGMQAVLVMFRSDGERRSFSVTRDITVVGRREDCDLRIPLGEVSRKHCRMVRDGDTLRLEDLGSSNGTFLNGTRVEREAVLNAGDSIQVGPVVFVLQVEGVPADGANGSHGANGGANGGTSHDYAPAAAHRQELGEEEIPELEPIGGEEP